MASSRQADNTGPELEVLLTAEGVSSPASL